MGLTKYRIAVVRVTSVDEITTTVNFAHDNSVPFVVRGGGHSTSGVSSITDGMVLDLSRMRQVTSTNLLKLSLFKAATPSTTSISKPQNTVSPSSWARLVTPALVD